MATNREIFDNLEQFQYSGPQLRIYLSAHKPIDSIRITQLLPKFYFALSCRGAGPPYDTAFVGKIRFESENLFVNACESIFQSIENFLAPGTALDFNYTVCERDAPRIEYSREFLK